MTKIECPHCEGAGEIWLPFFEDESQFYSIDASYYARWKGCRCGLCKGAGVVDQTNPNLCPSCQGTKVDSDGCQCQACFGYGFDMDSPDWEDEPIDGQA